MSDEERERPLGVEDEMKVIMMMGHLSQWLSVFGGDAVTYFLGAAYQAGTISTEMAHMQEAFVRGQRWFAIQVRSAAKNLADGIRIHDGRAAHPLTDDDIAEVLAKTAFLEDEEE